MAITQAQLINELRTKAGIQNNAFFDDIVELPGYIQDGLSNTYDTIVKAWAPYFAKKMPFTLTDSGELELDSIVNPTQDDITPFAADVPTVTIHEGTTDVTLTASPALTAPPVTFKVLTFSVSPVSPSVTGNTTFEIRVNGVATGCLVTVPSGSSSIQVNGLVNPTFSAEDTVTLHIVAPSGGMSGWNADIGVVVQPFLNNPPFYKELGVDWLGSGIALSVPRLPSFMNRNDGIYTSNPLSGDYVLHYVPSCPVLSSIVDLPQELERWKQMILLEAQIPVYMKRGLGIDAAREELNVKKREIEASAKSRIGEPKLIPTRMRSRSIGRSFDIIGSKLQIFPTIGNDGDRLAIGWGGW